MISKAGLGSRTEARSWIHARRVKVNGRVVENPDAWLDPEADHVSLDGKPVDGARKRYVLLHKPAGYITTYSDPEKRPTVYDLLSEVGSFLAPVGRLDLETSGLLLFTNDHEFAERMTNPLFHVPKTYRLEASTFLNDSHIEKLRAGLMLSDGPTRPAAVTRLAGEGKRTFLEIILTEGRNRQVRRMLEAVDSKVVYLARVAIGTISIDGLVRGKWRDLLPGEVDRLSG